MEKQIIIIIIKYIIKKINYIKIVKMLKLTFNIKLKNIYFYTENQEIRQAALQLLAVYFIYFYFFVVVVVLMRCLHYSKGQSL